LNKTLILPKESIRLLLLQRSQYRSTILRKFRSLFKRLGLSGFYQKYLSNFIDRLELLRKSSIEKQYFADLIDIYSSIESILPHTATRVLDVGAGMGGINLFFHRRYGQNLTAYLLDKDGESESIQAGFHINPDTFSKYNSFELARKFLIANGMRDESIVEINIDNTQIAEGPFDIVISLLSWGFHYPIETYLADISRKISSTGVLILDIRKGTNGIEVLADTFKVTPQIVFESEKFQRAVVRLDPTNQKLSTDSM
jgi:SAM-dependent methyltransferase